MFKAPLSALPQFGKPPTFDSMKPNYESKTDIVKEKNITHGAPSIGVGINPLLNGQKSINVDPVKVKTLIDEPTKLKSKPGYLLPPVNRKTRMSNEELHTGVHKEKKALPSADDISVDVEDLLPLGTTIQHAYDIEIEDDFKGTGKSFIHMWCLDQKSNPSLIRMQFPAFCYIELPEFVNGNPISWDKNSASRIVKYLQFVLKESGHSPTGWNLVWKAPIHYYKGSEKAPMLFLKFESVGAMRHCSRLVNKPRNIKGVGDVVMKMWENNISIIRKMFTLKDCRYSQWFRITGNEIPVGTESRITTPGTKERPMKEYICDWNTILPVSAEESKGWISYPRIFAIDIETYSDNHYAMPNEFDTKHVAYMISCIYQKLGDKSSREKVLIVLGECDDIPGSRIIRCKTEYEMVEEMGKLIIEYDPEIITGYNIFAYDYPYLDTRIKNKMFDWPDGMGRMIGKTPEMTTKSWNSGAYGHNSISNLKMEGRISIDMLPIIRRDYKLDKYSLDFVSKMFIKRGKHDIKAQEMFEIYELLKDAQDRMDKEKDEGQITQEAEEQLAFAKSEMSRVGDYCLEDSALVIDLFEKLNVWIGLVELSSIVGVTIVELFTRGQQIRCLSQVYNLSSKLGFVIDKRNAPKLFYSGGFVFEPKPGLYDNIICVDFASLYPSIMMAYNICYTTLLPKDREQTISDDLCNINEFDQEEPLDGLSKKSKRSGMAVNSEIEGVIPGINDDPDMSDGEEEDPEDAKKTVTRHYKFKFVKKEVRDGILPQLVRSLVNERGAVKKMIKNLKFINKKYVYTEKLLREYKSYGESLDQINEQLSAITIKIDNLSQTDEDVEIEKKCLEFAMENVSNWGNYNTAIDVCEKKISELTLQLVILDKRQAALKVSANSLYGFLGAQEGGTLPLIEAAMSVTAWGRELILAVNSHIEKKHGGTIVYGDTDSSMADMGITDPKETNKIGKMLEEEISGTPEKILSDGTVIPAVKGLFPPPLRVEFEKGMRLLCIKKKKYAYYEISNDGTYKCDKDTGEPIVNKKGIAIARRDNCKDFKRTYTKLLRGVLGGKKMLEGFNGLIEDIVRLLSYKIPPKGNLTIIRGLGMSYKSASYFMKVFSDELRRMGRPANPGDRLEYVVVRTKAEINGEIVPLGKKMRSIDMWDESNEVFGKGPPAIPKVGEKSINTQYVYQIEDIDVIYYLEHVYMNAIDQLFSIGYSAELKGLKDEVGYQPQYSRKQYGSVENPIRMIAKMIDDQLKAFSSHSNPEKEKIKHIAKSVSNLPKWLESEKEKYRIKMQPPVFKINLVGC